MEIANHNHLSFYPYDYEVQWLEMPTINGKALASFEIPCVISTKQHIVGELGVRLNCSASENYFIGFDNRSLMFAYNHTNDLRLAYKINGIAWWTIPDDQMTIDPNTLYKLFDCELICDYTPAQQTMIVNGIQRISTKQTDFDFTSSLFTIKHLGGQILRSGNRFKYCRVFTDDKRVLDLIPVVKDGRGCVFDKVSQACYEPVTDDDFIIGPTKGEES